MSNSDTFDEQWQRWFPEKKPEPTRRKRTIFWLLPTLVGVIVLLVLLNISKGFYADWLWFTSLGYGDVYATILQTRVLIFLSVAIIFFLFLWSNLLLATRLAPRVKVNFPSQFLTLGIVLGAVLVSLIFGLVAQNNWQVVLQYLNGQPFGVPDPVFHKEIGFYVYSLPFLNLVRGWLLGLLIITLIGNTVVYIFSYLSQSVKFDARRQVVAHVGGLIMAILGLFVWGYWLGIWELVFSSRGVVFGASYADMHGSLPAQWVLLAVVLICIVLLLVSILRHKFHLIAYGIGGWIVVAIFVGWLFPTLMHRFQVQPNELALEKPYIEYNIEFTREAFALNRIEEQLFPAEKGPTLEDIEQNEITISNIRLWDPRPLKDTYNQIQSIRLYYDFYDIDIDRYVIEGQYRQVMLSARELSADKLAGQAQTWVNRQLQFTHGYGIVLSPVNEVGTEGLPRLMVKDIPPIGNFIIKRPQIYFGEKTNDHVIVKTKTQEFDYPMGDKNAYGSWEGKNGVNIGSFLRRFIYAWELDDLNILISSEITPESEILYYRNVQQRVNHLAPFLKLDKDPYLVLMDGRLLWIQDCYTTTDRYPYSEPIDQELNYIRNSVKAVIDAYDGSVTFYVTEPKDALIRTYQTIFPSLFVPVEQMPESLRAHLRYPEDMFTMQATMYRAYHMRDAQVFYNKEDLWDAPREVYAGGEQPIEPYYIIMRLPDEDKEEFLLMLPFTPVKKNNTISWLAARCDGDNYGKLLTYYFPKERLVYGPSQIESRIQQDTVITEQLALWGRGGSQVIRGNLLMIPLGKSNLYVEPIFLQAEGGGLPELKRVIVAAGEQLAMKPTLAESITAVFNPEAQLAEPATIPEPATTPEPAAEPEKPEKPATTDIASLVKEAQQHYDTAQEYLKAGDWAGYGKELGALKAVLDRMAELNAETEK